MKSRRPLLAGLTLLALALVAFATTESLARGSSALTNAIVDEDSGPRDLFLSFPDVKWGMSFQDARNAIEKTGAHPAGSANAGTELAWDGKFSGLDGRGTVLLKTDGGVFEIAVVVQAMRTRPPVFDAWLRKLTAKLGAPKTEDTSVATSAIWKLPSGVVVELRSVKDPNSPVVDVHWVKE